MSKEKNVSDIVLAWLKANGYDGLTDDDGCGCTLEDFAPCGCCICNCFPGYNHRDKSESDFSISREKPKKPKNKSRPLKRGKT